MHLLSHSIHNHQRPDWIPRTILPWEPHELSPFKFMLSRHSAQHFIFLSDSPRMAALWAGNMGCDESFHVSPLRLLLHPSPLHHTSVLVLHTHEGFQLAFADNSTFFYKPYQLNVARDLSADNWWTSPSSRLSSNSSHTYPLFTFPLLPLPLCLFVPAYSTISNRTDHSGRSGSGGPVRGGLVDLQRDSGDPLFEYVEQIFDFVFEMAQHHLLYVSW